MLTKLKSASHILLCGLFLLEACAPTVPMLKKKANPLPSAFPTSESASTEGNSAEINWNEFFKDKQLDSLIELALKNNQELGILEQEISIANNEIMARQGEYLPKFNAGVDGGIEKTERFSTEDANSKTKFGRAGIAMSWEVDIWKKLRNATKSAYFSYLGSIEGKRYVTTNLIAEVANTYYELMALDNQLEIVKSYVKVLAQIRDMVDLQQKAGRVTTLPVKRFDAEVLKNKARQVELEQDLIITQNKMNLLLGRYPQDISRDSKDFFNITFSKISTSVPTKLLDNRPDIRRASYELEAAKLNVDVAKARFYPSLSIDGSYGYEQFNSKHFDGTPTSIFYGLAASLTAPILNRKAIKADYISANNKQVQAVYEFEKTLVQAYTEVVNQMNMIKNYDSVYNLKSSQVKALNESIEISNVLFKAARVDYIESLMTQRDSLEAQVELVDIKRKQLTAYVSLYKALGGGWKGTSENYKSVY
ncbi:TolC family protein [Peredibacter starrii]|uniref:TolC family protein n=1 Tax=Peredibacter starrii TaxID=28202 RepID=A0AAX4HK01_9BACT|nr:TolC family protein [Peredibacter starrii]WPU63569.1 TolC family protein [Peredibacter starrii]